MSKIVLALIFILILIVLVFGVVRMKKEKYNGTPPNWLFSSMDNAVEEDQTQKKCAGKKWNSNQ